MVAKKTRKPVVPGMPAVIGGRQTKSGKHATYELPAAEIIKNIDQWLKHRRDVIEWHPPLEQYYLKIREDAVNAVNAGKKYIWEYLESLRQSHDGVAK